MYLNLLKNIYTMYLNVLLLHLFNLTQVWFPYSKNNFTFVYKFVHKF